MTFKRRFRVAETTTSTGTGDIVLAGAVTGYREFGEVFFAGDAATIVIEAIDSSGAPTGQWEICDSQLVSLGVWSWALTRGMLRASSDFGSRINFAAGTKRVFAIDNGFSEQVFAITDGATVNLDPNRGSIQTWTLGANRTPGQANWAAGQSITLMIDDGSAFSITWSTLAVVWKSGGGTAPTLQTTGFTVIVLWKVGTTIYGARVGDA